MWGRGGPAGEIQGTPQAFGAAAYLSGRLPEEVPQPSMLRQSQKEDHIPRSLGGGS